MLSITAINCPFEIFFKVFNNIPQCLLITTPFSPGILKQGTCLRFVFRARHRKDFAIALSTISKLTMGFLQSGYL